MTKTLSTDITSKVNITAKRGDRFSLSMIFTDKDKNPIDFTGYTFLMQVKDYEESSTSKLVFETGNGIEITGEGNNVLLFTKSGSEMNIRAGSYVYDLQSIDPSGEPLTYTAGKFIIVQDVTRS